MHRIASSCMAAVCAEAALSSKMLVLKAKLMTGLYATLNARPRKLTCESAAVSWPLREKHQAAKRPCAL